MSTRPRRPQLLVSVRSASEAMAALEGGADLIDVKEPTRGPLGAADHSVVQSIVTVVAGRVPVSAAMGEWIDWKDQSMPAGLTYAKWGLSGCSAQAAGRICEVTGVLPVLVAYADYERAQSPWPLALVEAACDLCFSAFLIDTAVKDGSTLLDWLDFSVLKEIRQQLADAGVPLALAGSLDENSLCKLAPIAPRWVAVRGAACVGGREGVVASDRVRSLRRILAEP